MEIILASGSPRRRELLGLCCPDFRVEVSGAERGDGGSAVCCAQRGVYVSSRRPLCGKLRFAGRAFGVLSAFCFAEGERSC